MAAFGVEQIQNGGRCHGNQGAKNVKFTQNFTNFCSNASCHTHL
jgi:ribosomal protein L35AE/L33A